MPIFEFACKDCQYQFNLLISNVDKDKVKCPQCFSSDVKQLLSMFSTGKGKGPETGGNCYSCARSTSG